ncbi:hypothetical protein IV454_09295 [Massilia antarctica]|uniref:YceI family protein n=1 Tax=Massilia antarctica TaxID=2765360 RepID=A0AA48WFT9_9BURK|nr:hypothetical protein [Massilia antarctica]QPI51671.1 hypothetical protein IV454_09295 [Massilia antarctica]
MSRPLLPACACAALLLSGCLVPERFTARAAFQADGSYEYSYAGTAVHTIAAGQLAKGGKLVPKDEESLGSDAAAIRHDQDIRQAEYKGNARYDLSVEGKRQRGQALDLLGVLRVATDKDGVVTLAAGKLDNKEKASMAKLGIKLDGTLSVTVPISAQVLSHNATSTPSFFGLIGTYSWKIGSIEQRPEMKIRFKP